MPGTGQGHVLRWVAALVAVLAVAAVPTAAQGGRTATDALHLVHIAKLTNPLYATAPAGATGKLYVVEQPGEIVSLTNGQLDPTPFLDIHTLVTTANDEQGLLSMAFDPNYATNHRFYICYIGTDTNIHVVRYLSNGTTAIPSSAKQILFVKDVAPNHNGGQLQFGPNGLLYWSNGDGGGENDQFNLGQELNKPFAKIMSYNVNAAKPSWKLVAYGLRNPWRYSFDRATGDLYIGDVGQNSWEEIDYLKHGFSGVVNFGWSHFEGNHIFNAKTPLLKVGRYVAPIAEYNHQNHNCAVIGGYVYRGPSIPAAVGRYFYGDDCSGTVWSLKVVNGKATTVRTEPFSVAGLSGFGQDSQGNLYLMSVSSGDLYELAG